MWDALREKKLGVRIMLGVVVGILGIGMLLYLVPQGGDELSGADNVAQVGDQTISMVDVQNQLSKTHFAERQIPPALHAACTRSRPWIN